MYKERIVFKVGQTVKFTDRDIYKVTNIQRDCYNSVEVTIKNENAELITVQENLILVP